MLPGNKFMTLITYNWNSFWMQSISNVDWKIYQQKMWEIKTDLDWNVVMYTWTVLLPV